MKMSELEKKLLPGRVCGECTACCITLRIDDPDLKKYADIPCSKLRPDGGCGIYESRPDVCRGWYCAWRFMPQLDDDWRPDRSKIIIRIHTGAKGGLVLQPMGKASELLLSEKVLSLVGSFVEQSVPIYISLPTKPRRCHALLQLNSEFQQAVASRIMPALQFQMLKAIEYGSQVETDPISKIEDQK
jgi:hypothetical protein